VCIGRNRRCSRYVSIQSIMTTPMNLTGVLCCKTRIPRHRHRRRHRLARHAYICTSNTRDFLVRILARMSARMSVSVSWNASLTEIGGRILAYFNVSYSKLNVKVYHGDECRICIRLWRSLNNYYAPRPVVVHGMQ